MEGYLYQTPGKTQPPVSQRATMQLTQSVTHPTLENYKPDGAQGYHGQAAPLQLPQGELDASPIHPTSRHPIGMMSYDVALSNVKNNFNSHRCVLHLIGILFLLLLHRLLKTIIDGSVRIHKIGMPFILC